MTQRRRVLGLPPLAWILLSCLLSFGIWTGRRLLRESRAQQAVQFDPRRLDLTSRLPDWLDEGQARSVLEEYLRVSGPPFPLLDDERFFAWVRRVRALPWIAAMQVRRQLPDRVQLAFDLRRPRLLAAGPGRWLSYVTEDGSLLPLAESELAVAGPRRALFLAQEAGGEPFRVPAAGSELAAVPALPRLLGAGELLRGEAGQRLRRGAAGIVRVWEEELRAGLGADEVRGLTLVGVDGANESWEISRSKARYRLVLRSSSGRAVHAAWGHEPDGDFEAIPVATKRQVLAAALDAQPGLAGVLSLDLRFPQTWRQRLVLVSPEPGTGKAAARSSRAGETERLAPPRRDGTR